MTFLQFVKMLPQLYRLVQFIQLSLKKMEETKKLKAAKELSNAVTESEVKDAAEDYLNH